MISQILTFKKFIPLLKELTSRDIKLKYRRSVLGIVWSVLNPLLMMLVITAVFSTIFRFDIPNFPIYYLTGSTVFGFFSEATTGAMSSVIYSASLIKKVYMPKYLFPLEKIIFAFVNMLFSLIAVFFVMVLTNTELYATIFISPLGLIYTFVFSIGVGLILASMAVFFRDIVHLYSVLITALTYFTPIIYPIEALPENIAVFMKLNPLYHYVNFFRDCVLYGEVPSLEENLICIVLAIVSLLIGLLVFKKNQDKFILYI
ncbi:MAG: ABC transporter permease [Clostridia bacterium]